MKEKKNETLHMRVKPSQKEQWAKEAARQGKTLSQWVCDKLDNALKRAIV